MAITPAIMVSIIPLEFFAEANVQSAHDEEHDDDSDKKQIQHDFRFKFISKRHTRYASLEAIITLPSVRENRKIN
jgi:hypothetical protein